MQKLVLPPPSYSISESFPQLNFPDEVDESHMVNLWRSIATGLGGMVMGLMIAWFTAWQNKGVSSKEMTEYVRDYGPYVFDKPTLVEHNRQQDEKIGILIGGDERIQARLNALENYNVIDIKEKQDLETKLTVITHLLEEQQKLGHR